jgi:phosphate transport system permease protein
MHSKRIWNSLRRQIVGHLASWLMGLSTLAVLAPLLAILIYLLYQGASSISWSFLMHLSKPVGESGGGMANAIAGSALILAEASLMGIPVGVAAGIYLSEFAHNKFGTLIRFSADVLNGVPSIVIGLTAYAIVVLPARHFSALAGGVALAIMMVPTISRTTEEALRMVPGSVREAAFGLGILERKTVVSIVLPAARSGIVTGAMLAFARVAGETAPLLFTALGNQFWNLNPSQPTAALPLQIFAYAISPYDDWHKQAWAGALVLIVLIMGVVTVVRIAASRSTLRGTS